MSILWPEMIYYQVIHYSRYITFVAKLAIISVHEFVLWNMQYEFREQTFIHAERTEARFELQNVHFNEVDFKALNICYFKCFNSGNE